VPILGAFAFLHDGSLIQLSVNLVALCAPGKSVRCAAGAVELSAAVGTRDAAREAGLTASIPETIMAATTGIRYLSPHLKRERATKMAALFLMGAARQVAL